MQRRPSHPTALHYRTATLRGALCCVPPQRFAARADGIRSCAPIAAGNVNVSLATLTLIMSMLRNNMLSAIPYVRFAFACGHLTSPLFLIRHATQPYPALSLAHASPTVVCVAAPYTQPLPVPPHRHPHLTPRTLTSCSPSDNVKHTGRCATTCNQVLRSTRVEYSSVAAYEGVNSGRGVEEDLFTGEDRSEYAVRRGGEGDACTGHVTGRGLVSS